MATPVPTLATVIPFPSRRRPDGDDDPSAPATAGGSLPKCIPPPIRSRISDINNRMVDLWLTEMEKSIKAFASEGVCA